MKFAMIAQAVTMILTFVSKPVIIHLAGIEAHSINSLFTQVISAISLAEMGVGSAIVYNLYKPLAEENHEAVKAVYHGACRVFRVTGLVCIAASIAVALIFPSSKLRQYQKSGVECLYRTICR